MLARAPARRERFARATYCCRRSKRKYSAVGTSWCFRRTTSYPAPCSPRSCGGAPPSALLGLWGVPKPQQGSPVFPLSPYPTAGPPKFVGFRSLPLAGITLFAPTREACRPRSFAHPAAQPAIQGVLLAGGLVSVPAHSRAQQRSLAKPRRREARRALLLELRRYRHPHPPAPPVSESETERGRQAGGKKMKCKYMCLP